MSSESKALGEPVAFAMPPLGWIADQAAKLSADKDEDSVGALAWNLGVAFQRWANASPIREPEISREADRLRLGIAEIMAGLVKGEVGGEDVVWFSTIETLWEFCASLLDPSAPGRFNLEATDPQAILNLAPVGGRGEPDEVTEDALLTRAKALIQHKGWKPGDKFSAWNVAQLMVAFGLDLTRKPESARCGHPDCGCDFDAVCDVALPTPPQEQGGMK